MSSAYKTHRQVVDLCAQHGGTLEDVEPVAGFEEEPREYRIKNQAGDLVFQGTLERCGDFMNGFDRGWYSRVPERGNY